MKTTLKIIILLFTLNTFGQNLKINDPRLNPFIGTWTAQYDQNKVFTMTLWREDHSLLMGDYKIEILDSNGNVVKTWKSNFIYPNTNQEMPPSIYGRATSNLNIAGTAFDITINVGNGLANRKGKEGSFSMTIQSTSNPTTAHWTVEDNAHVVLEGHPDHFSVPTDIVLTKQ